MTWTYTMEFATVPRDEVRLLVQDTTETEQLLMDEEIDYILLQNGSHIKATALEVARIIHAKFTKRVDKEVGDLRNFWSQRAKNYMDVVNRLERALAITGAPYAGGISEADKDSSVEDIDRVIPKFTKEKHRNPNTSAEINDIRKLE